ncbi:MAG: hypothetical protein HF982_05305 [Desulfobacteraceae bacterium]|nr:hypothetical protein [Desulfobacteraceae bacterium]MBC2718995.1 hypothetical protein [Desulfobacteraceae bacterium]
MDITKSYDANFVFLENRSYVHVSSMTHGLFEAVKSWSLGHVERVQVNVHSLLKEQGRYDLFHSESGKEHVKKEYNAIFRLQCGRNVYFVGLQGRGEPVVVSEPYDEKKLIAGCEIIKDRKSATLMLHPDALVINIIIALNKKLVYTLFPSEGYGQWFLARYDLDLRKTRLIEPALLEIEVVGNIGATNTNSAIRLDGESIGSIYFSRNIK